MKIKTDAIATMLTMLLIVPASGFAQTIHKGAIFIIAAHPGEAPILQINGKSYVEIETLARLTKGNLSFKGNQTTLTLPPSNAEVKALGPQVPAPPVVKAGLSKAFIQTGVEEISVIREWRAAIVNAVQKNTPVAEDWVSAQHRLADKNLALASAAIVTDDDRQAYSMLSVEFNNMQKLSELYLAMRQRSAFISPDAFDNGPLELQILSCAEGFASISEKHEFQDLPACH